MLAHTLRVLQLHTLAQLRAELDRVGADSSLPEKLARGSLHVVRLERVSLPLARFLYQELAMEGGQVITAPRLDHVGDGATDVLLCATRYQLDHLVVRLRWQPHEELQLLGDELARALDAFDASPPALQLGAMLLKWDTRTYIMGILNLTPDSFSGDGLIRAEDSPADYVARVVARARELVRDGADILDLGGESTRPGATPVDAATELARVLPVIRTLARELDKVPLSIDTHKAAVAAAALDEGAQLVNDVSGLSEPELPRIAASHHAALVLMHSWQRDAHPALNGRAVLDVIVDELHIQRERALDAGVPADQLLVDPGLGFGKTPGENLEILNRLGELRVFGQPILIGPSRKGFISHAINVPKDEREEGTAAAVALGIARGANLVRVHDVKSMVRVSRMTDAITKT